jgi:hypothetical protein
MSGDTYFLLHGKDAIDRRCDAFESQANAEEWAAKNLPPESNFLLIRGQIIRFGRALPLQEAKP